MSLTTSYLHYSSLNKTMIDRFSSSSSSWLLTSSLLFVVVVFFSSFLFVTFDRLISCLYILSKFKTCLVVLLCLSLNLVLSLSLSLDVLWCFFVHTINTNTRIPAHHHHHPPIYSSNFILLTNFLIQMSYFKFFLSLSLPNQIILLDLYNQTN